MERYCKYALEGLDGVGKTTVGKLLAGEMGGQYLDTMVGNIMEPYRELVRAWDANLRFIYFLSVGLDAHNRAEEMRKSGHVFADRTICANIAYQAADGLNPAMLKLVPQFLLDSIDLMIYFVADDDTRRERIGQRSLAENKSISDVDLQSIGSEYSRLVDLQYRRIMPEKTIFYEVGQKSPAQIAGEIKALLSHGTP